MVFFDDLSQDISIRNHKKKLREAKNNEIKN